jgi:hypothetical protein
MIYISQHIRVANFKYLGTAIITHTKLSSPIESPEQIKNASRQSTWKNAGT